MPNRCEPWSFSEVPDCPQTQAPNIHWVQEKESKYYSISMSPVNEPPLQVPQRGPSGERCPFPEPPFTYPSGSPVKDPPQYFVKVGLKFIKFLNTQCSPTTCKSYLVPNIVCRTLFAPNIVFRNLFCPAWLSENCSSHCSPQKPLRSKYRPQTAVRSQYHPHQTLQSTVVPRRLFGPISSSEPCFRSPSAYDLLLQPETKCCISWNGGFCCHAIKGTR